MTIDEMIEVLQAAKEGKQIEKKMKFGKGAQWQRAGTPDWDFDCFIYRVKQEPMEYWAVIDPDGCAISTLKRKSDAQKSFERHNAYLDCEGVRMIKLVEVDE